MINFSGSVPPLPFIQCGLRKHKGACYE